LIRKKQKNRIKGGSNCWLEGVVVHGLNIIGLYDVLEERICNGWGVVWEWMRY
jgi:hypothetical protein